VLSEHGIQIAPSTYYARLQTPVSAAEWEQAYLANALVDLHRANWGVYGARKLWHAARRAGLEVGRDQVSRLMRLAGIAGAVRGRHRTTTTRRDETAARHPDLVKRGWTAPTGTDQLWVADFSYVWTLTGFVYVALVVDVFSRRILGWRVSSSRQTWLVLDAFRQALHTRHRGTAAWTGAGLVHHSDAGSQGGPTWTDRAAVEWQVARWVHWFRPPGCTPRSGTCRPLSSNSITGRVRSWPPSRRSRKPPTLREIQGGSFCWLSRCRGARGRWCCSGLWLRRWWLPCWPVGFRSCGPCWVS
jgi:putative transposase